MRSYFRGQLNYLNAAWKNAAPGRNWAGFKQSIFENRADALADEGYGALLGLGFSALPYAAIGGLGAFLATHDVGGNIGVPIGATLIGAAAGGALGKIGAKRGAEYFTKGMPNRLLASSITKGAGILGPIGGSVVGGTLGLMAGAIGAGHTGLALGIGAGAAGLGGLWALTGIGPLTPLKGIGKAFGGTRGILGAGMGLGASLMGGAITAAKGVEFAARTALTGGVRGVQSPLDAWFPYFRNSPPIAKQGWAHNEEAKLWARKKISEGMSARDAIKEAKEIKSIDFRRFALNPRVVRRMVGGSALFAIGSAIHEAVSPMTPPPTAFFDGRYMRHVNDLGTGGSYGMGMMGRNSNLDFSMQDAARIVSHAF
jgi:hypothetical protein